MCVRSRCGRSRKGEKKKKKKYLNFRAPHPRRPKRNAIFEKRNKKEYLLDEQTVTETFDDTITSSKLKLVKP